MMHDPARTHDHRVVRALTTKGHDITVHRTSAAETGRGGRWNELPDGRGQGQDAAGGAGAQDQVVALAAPCGQDRQSASQTGGDDVSSTTPSPTHSTTTCLRKEPAPPGPAVSLHEQGPAAVFPPSRARRRGVNWSASHTDTTYAGTWLAGDGESRELVADRAGRLGMAQQHRTPPPPAGCGCSRRNARANVERPPLKTCDPAFRR